MHIEKLDGIQLHAGLKHTARSGRFEVSVIQERSERDLGITADLQAVWWAAAQDQAFQGTFMHPC